MPLAVVGSNVVIEVNGRKVRGRQYPWGVAEGRHSPASQLKQTRRKNVASVMQSLAICPKEICL